MIVETLLVILSSSLLVCADPIDPAPSRLITESLVLSNGLDWGDWGVVQYCEDGSFAVDFEVKFEDYGLIDVDETALNAVKLYCSSPNGHHTGYITSTEGNKGEWKGFKTCPNGYLTGLRARILEPQGVIGDDVAIQNLEMECNYGESTVIGIDETTKISDGEWSVWAKCDNGSAICGLEIRFEDVNWIFDDAAVSDIAMFCCDLEEPPIMIKENDDA